MVHYLFIPWNLPWIILACYGNQQKKKKTKKKKQSIIPRSDAVVCDIWSGRTRFGNSFIESGTDKLCWSKQKRRGRKRCVQAVHSFITLSKATFDLFGHADCTWMFCSLSVFTRVTQTDYLSDYHYWWFVLIACLPHKGLTDDSC